MSKRIKKTKVQKIQEAVNSLNKALEMEEPDIRIRLPMGFYDNEESREFVGAMKGFIKAYKKFYGQEKIKVEITV